MFRTTALAAVTAVAAVALAACSISEVPLPASPDRAAPATQLARPPGTIVSANSTATLGTVVVDGLGFTLYRFDGDSARPPAAKCDGQCAETWDPVLATQPITTDGVDEKALGSVVRPDGQAQLTIGGWPVYRHSGDAPGATDGQGAQGKWFAITPNGAKAAAH